MRNEDKMRNEENLKQAVKEQFSRNAEKYVLSETHAKSDDLYQLTQWLEPQKGWDVLDIATGGGHVAKQLAPYIAHLFAADLTKEMLATAQKYLKQFADNIWYVVADAENLPFLDHTFDAVTCRIAAHHFPNPQQFILEATRVLKPGGKLLLIDNIAPDDDILDAYVNKLEKLRDTSHVRCYRKREWLLWTEDAGLKERSSRVRKKTFDFTTWVKRTTESEKQVNEVREHILKAPDDIKEYIGAAIIEGEISSITIDEWMVLLTKPGN